MPSAAGQLTTAGGVGAAAASPPFFKPLDADLRRAHARTAGAPQAGGRLSSITVRLPSWASSAGMRRL